MITWNRPPLKTGQVVAALLDWRRRFSVAELEEAYARAFGVPHALWLPSARAGIDWALRAALDPGTPALCSAFTCKVVHEAIVRSGREMRLVDVAPGRFLMDAAAIADAAVAPHALILCEMYGHTYDLAAVDSATRIIPRIRILDMAMTVPSGALLARLHGNDFAVISFGIGKCLYAEWGGMAFTRDAALAQEVRRLRDAGRSAAGPFLGLQRTLRILLRTAVATPEVFTLSRTVRRSIAPRPRNIRGSKNAATGAKPGMAPAEWRLPSTRLDRQLIHRHLELSQWYTARRLALAARYHELLRNVPGIVQPPPSAQPLSHYTIRVSAAARAEIQSRLRAEGIAAGTLFEFGRYLSPQEFPNASAVAAEVLNLPLSVDLEAAQIEHIAAAVVRSVTRAGALSEAA